MTGGASSYRESVALDARLLEDSVRLLQALRWTGLAMVEFKVGADGYHLMEINGRVWGSLPLAVAVFHFGAAVAQTADQKALSINGQVLDDQGLPVPGVVVIAYPDAGLRAIVG